MSEISSRSRAKNDNSTHSGYIKRDKRDKLWKKFLYALLFLLYNNKKNQFNERIHEILNITTKKVHLFY